MHDDNREKDNLIVVESPTNGLYDAAITAEPKYSINLGNFLKIFTINIQKTGLNGYVPHFSVDYNVIDTSDILDIHKYLTGKTLYKIK